MESGKKNKEKDKKSFTWGIKRIKKNTDVNLIKLKMQTLIWNWICQNPYTLICQYN